MKASSDCRSGELIQHGLSVAQVGVPKPSVNRWTTSKTGRAPAQVGLPHPVWATISALIVSQDKLADMHASFVRRSGGTLIGIVAGVITNLTAAYLATVMAG
jgi:ABC-type nitrate/sulfonate/bicarbonate transport system permease component